MKTFLSIAAFFMFLSFPIQANASSVTTVTLSGSNATSHALRVSVAYETVQTTAELSFMVEFANNTTASIPWETLFKNFNVTLYDAQKNRTILPVPGIDETPHVLWARYSSVPSGLMLPGSVGTIIFRCREVPKSGDIFNINNVMSIPPGKYAPRFSFRQGWKETGEWPISAIGDCYGLGENKGCIFVGGD